jgi:hypothetical protein
MHTEGDEMDDDDIAELGAAIRETQVAQMLASLRALPHMLSRLEGMAKRGDDVAKEVVRRFKAAK